MLRNFVLPGLCFSGGTGITPMLQALHMLLTTAGDDTQIVMLNGNKSMEDVLMKVNCDD